MARLFSIFFCFVAPTLADYAVLPEEATGPNMLTCILMDACVHVVSRLRVCRCAFLFPLTSSCSMSPLQIMSLRNHQSDPRLFATYFSSVIHKHATLSKPSKSLTSNPYRSQATAAGGLHFDLILPSDSNTVPVLVDTFEGDSTAYQRNYTEECEGWCLCLRSA